MKRSRLIKAPFPTEWRSVLERNIAFYRELNPTQKEKFENDLNLFVWEKGFIGGNGFEITDEIRITIAASAVRLIIGLEYSIYDHLYEVVVYNETAFRGSEDEQWRVGEAHSKMGTVVLSWPAVKAGLKNPHDSQNVAYHEFAHMLDRGDGAYDGTPELHAREDFRRWALVMSPRFLNLREGKKYESKVLDDYGATNEAEFFAVLTETFFENPAKLKKKLPKIYEELVRFYRTDPTA